MHLITGYSGEPHITSANDGQVNAHIFGKEKYVFDSRDKFSADIVSNNIVRIHSGEGLLNGRYFEIAEDSTENANIENGTAGTNRIDLIVARYEKDDESKIETMTLTTIKGIEGANPFPPAYESGNILDGVGIADFPLYKVTLESLTIKSVEPLFEIRKDLVTDVKENNANTLEAIKVDNQQTVESVATSNAQTVEAVEESNTRTLESVDNKLATTLTATVIWESDNTLNPHHGVDISHPSINNYKYVEVVFTHQDTGEIPLDQVRYYSTGLIPVINNNTIYTMLSVTYSPARDDGSLLFKNKTRVLRIVGKKTYTSEADTVQFSIGHSPAGVNAFDRSIVSNENGICINKIIAFK